MTDKRGRGRPPVGRVVQVKIPDDLIARLDRVAAEHGISRSELMRRLLLDAVRSESPVSR